MSHADARAAVAPQAELDSRNAGFWDMICGSSLAKYLNISALTPEALAKFDSAFFELYPYLRRYIPLDRVAGQKVLEVGLGFGTLGQLLSDNGADYHGLDIAPAPVELMRARLGRKPGFDAHKIKVGSALQMPFADNSFDRVFSLGCFHHTGSTKKCIDEVFRVLKPGGTATIMLYHRYSYRRAVEAPIAWLRYRFTNRYDKAKYPTFATVFNGMFDANFDGVGCPHVEFVSRREARALFARFASCEVSLENWLTPINWFGGLVQYDRTQCMQKFSRFMGHDVYIVAVK